MKIRKIKLNEIDEIVKLLINKYPNEKIDIIREHTEWHVRGFPEFCLVAEENNEIIGFIICHLHTNNLEIEELYALKDKEWIYKSLILEVLNRIPRVNTITIWIDDFKELISQMK
ncbi:MAG: hypothetical protein DRO15_01010 [Thermoprotei archaeon]|nr:MAG: hypothetical protein DRO15_01010 [Thermoprotei archaeon]